MSDQLNRIEDKIDSHTDRLGKIEGRLETYNKQLEIHIKRTEQNENAIKKSEADIDSRLKPIEKHVNSVNTILKVIGFFASLAGLLTLILKLTGII